MAAEQSMTQAIMQAEIEATEANNMVVREADSLVSYARPVHAASGSGGPAVKEATFHWKAADKCQELCNFDIEVKRTFS